MKHHNSFTDSAVSSFIQASLKDKEASCLRGVFSVGLNKPEDESIVIYVYPSYSSSSAKKEVRIIFDYRLQDRRICSYTVAFHPSRKSEFISLTCNKIITELGKEVVEEDKVLVDSLQRRFLIDNFLVEENNS